VQVDLPDGQQVRYAYNAFGERIAKTFSDAVGKSRATYYLYQDRQLDAEIDAEGNVSAQYIYLGHVLVAKLDYSTSNARSSATPTNRLLRFSLLKGWSSPPAARPNTRVSFIHSDHLGTPQLATDDAQIAVWRAQHSEFGQAQVTVDSITLNTRFPGQYFVSDQPSHLPTELRLV